MAIITFDVPTDMTQLTIPTTLDSATSTAITVSNGTTTDVINGNFAYVGTQVSGTITSIDSYNQGSLVAQITGLDVNAATAESLIIANNTQGVLNLALSGNNVINGSFGSDVLVDLGGNNVFVPNGGTNTVEGGAGFDQVLIHAPLAASSYSTTNGVTTVTSPEGVDIITNVQRIQFSDGVLALDTQGNAGNVYRLYQAAFAETPDTPGLSFWVHAADTGISMQTIAQDFTNSSQFQALYGGANPSPTTVIDLLYQHVFGRAPDQAGFNFWLNAMETGTSVGAVLLGFSISSEDHALVDPKIAQGIVLDQSAFLV